MHKDRVIASKNPRNWNRGEGQILQNRPHEKYSNRHYSISAPTIQYKATSGGPLGHVEKHGM